MISAEAAVNEAYTAAATRTAVVKARSRTGPTGHRRRPRRSAWRRSRRWLMTDKTARGVQLVAAVGNR